MSEYDPEPPAFATAVYLLLAAALLGIAVAYKRWEYRECLAVGHDRTFCQVQACAGGKR